jgi:hypothetical protein
MIIVSNIICAIYITHMCAHPNWGRVWVERPNAILFEEICIYYMHFVCWNAYILWNMLIIESMLYVFWMNCVWSAVPNVFLLVSSGLPYVLMS